MRRARYRWTALSLANSLSRFPLLAGFAGTAVAVLMAGLSLATLYQGREEALSHAQETSANLVSIIGGDIARNVEIYDLSLRAVVDGAQDTAVMALPLDLRRRILFDRATTAAYIGGGYVIDAHGRAIVKNNATAVPAETFAEREYFRAHQQNPSVGLFFSHPYMTHANGAAIGMSRRINAPDGSFAGIALLTVNLQYFRSLLDKIEVGPKGSIFIVQDDGAMIVRKPFLDNDLSRNVSGSASFARMTRTRSGSYVAKSPVDGVERIYTFAHVPGTPFIVGVAPAQDDVLDTWRARSSGVGVLTLLFGLSFIALSWLLALSLRERARAQEELVRLAGTDALTGLPNRRAFDERMDEEWRRARRSNTAVSVLFIDVDYFKAYNDNYGHAVGDDALAAVAECIALSVRRPGDIPARYGGEEFVVLLPDTQIDGALHIAETIRTRIRTRSIAHRGSVIGRLTVSIGCATAAPPGLGGAYGLLSAADQQLYEAKAAGRDCVRPMTLANVEIAQS
ncbi:GGDEF domain-containing protein [Caballeronia sp. dw_276]|jgi:diguanylate cyclase (GGDEF)-like protein|uniref:sensor domain-containing diguanylate cyclase n=1 Tax=Caballeronia sp. dw_276 TaxID=2719795 RepID=UPI001BD2694C|nr:GGDEF domain-containing protein [Caballeronia sp. dw_276]